MAIGFNGKWLVSSRVLLLYGVAPCKNACACTVRIPAVLLCVPEGQNVQMDEPAEDWERCISDDLNGPDASSTP